MRIKRTFVLVAVIAFALLSVSAGLAYASNSSSHFQKLKFNIVGIPASFVGVTVRGVSGGGFPWVAQGRVELPSNGRLQADVDRLLLAAGSAAGTTGPVTGVRASLTCESTNVVATTDVFPLDSAGNAQIKQTLTLPSSCIGPIILIRVGSTTTSPGPLNGPWIAITGF